MPPARSSKYKFAALPRRLALGLALTWVVQAVLAADIYRYVDDKGRTVMSSSIPPEYVRKGYTVLDERGRVLRQVAPAPSADELAAREREAARQAEEALALQRQREADQLLLRMYRTPAEVARKRDEKLDLLAGQTRALQASLSKSLADAALLEQKVTKAVASAVQVAPATLERLEQLRAEQTRLDEQLARIAQDAQVLSADAERDMARLRDLLEGR